MATSMPFDDFKKVVANTPLIAIDLLVRDCSDRLLLGLRKNSPARDYWFVPGGRVRKNESLDDAFLRLTLAELGLTFQRSSSSLFGVFEHFYTEDFTGDHSFGGTHYVVLAYELRLVEILQSDLPSDQHSDYKWCTDGDVLADLTVHSNTKAYCRGFND